MSPIRTDCRDCQLYRQGQHHGVTAAKHGHENCRLNLLPYCHGYDSGSRGERMLHKAEFYPAPDDL